MPQENEKKESAPSMMRPDSTLVTLALAAVLALVISGTAAYLPIWSGQRATNTAGLATPGTGAPIQVNSASIWAASAPGRVKPMGGEIKLQAEAPGIITDVYAKINDQVLKGDPIAVIKSQEALARLGAARAEVQVRIAEREEEPEQNQTLVEWRKVLDGLAAVERKLHVAKVQFDDEFVARKAGDSSDEKVSAARKAIVAAKAMIASRRRELVAYEAKTDLSPSTRLDSGLAIARSDLRLAEIAFDKTRIRATADGAILRLDAKVGEFASPSAPVPVAVIGNTANLEVTAEVEERDISLMSVGQEVVIRSNAFEGQDFSGKVTRIAPRVGSPALGLRGPNKPRDVEILEVEILLGGHPPLLSGMRVDVFFKPTGGAKAAAAVKN